ncbi:hypothetical protein LD39_09615 [Halobacillus sp. BBL2006]|nr:hypothetical protein LD39_09615 [Halobacillus sp. BBL2006]
MVGKGIKEVVNLAWISGWLVMVLCLLANVSPWFLIVAMLGKGIGGMIYLFNFVSLFLLIRYRKIYLHDRPYKRKLLLILVYLVVYPFLFISIMEGV